MQHDVIIEFMSTHTFLSGLLRPAELWEVVQHRTSAAEHTTFVASRGLRIRDRVKLDSSCTTWDVVVTGGRNVKETEAENGGSVLPRVWSCCTPSELRGSAGTRPRRSELRSPDLLLLLALFGSTLSGPTAKPPRSGNDVLPKSNGASHRGPRLRARDGDTARALQKERCPGPVSGTRTRTRAHSEGVYCCD